MSGMGLTLEPQVLPLKMDDGGTIRVAGTRVTLDTLVAFYQQGYAAERLHDAFPTVPLADIHSAIGYYLRHTAEVEAYIAQRRQAGEKYQQLIEALVPPNQVTADDLRARLRARGGGDAPPGEGPLP
jgi:uncharacterized protein (DUF433 family)